MQYGSNVGNLKMRGIYERHCSSIASQYNVLEIMKENETQPNPLIMDVKKNKIKVTTSWIQKHGNS